jgi:hypothetical protein
MFIPRPLLKRERQPSGTEKGVPWRQMPFLQNLIVPSKELPRTLKCIRTMFEARDVISYSASLSIWYIEKFPENLSLLRLPTVGENPGIGKNV